MTSRKEDLLDRFPPGFSSKRYRATPEEIEELKRSNRIQRERDERAWAEAMEKERERSENSSEDKSA